MRCERQQQQRSGMPGPSPTPATTSATVEDVLYTDNGQRATGQLDGRRSAASMATTSAETNNSSSNAAAVADDDRLLQWPPSFAADSFAAAVVVVDAGITALLDRRCPPDFARSPPIARSVGGLLIACAAGPSLLRPWMVFGVHRQSIPQCRRWRPAQRTGREAGRLSLIPSGR